MIRSTLCVLLTLTLTTPTHAQPRDLTEDLEAIRSSLDLPSLAAAAYRDGTLIGVGATGWYSMEHAVPVSTKSRYHIGSCTKAMTAVVLGSVIEQAEGLDWDTTLADALPDDAEFINDAYAAVTIRELLGHRSGLVENRDQMLFPLAWSITAEFANAALTIQRQELTRTALAVAPAIEPGTEYAYSNYAYIIAARIAETQADSPFEELLRARVFEPLGMTTAGFGPPGGPGEVVEPLGHSKQDEWRPMMFSIAGVAPDNPPIFNSAGRVHASIADWGRFVDDFEQGLDGQGKLLATETYEAIASDLEDDGYALGWGVNPRGWAGDAPALAHAGSNRYWYSIAWLAPDKNLAMVAAVNAATPEARLATDRAIELMIQSFTWTPEQIEAASSPLAAPGDDDAPPAE